VQTIFQRYFRGLSAAWLVLFVSLGAVAVAFWKVHASAVWRDHRRFDQEVATAGEELKSRITRYEELVELLRRQIEAYDDLTVQDWHRIAGSIEWLRNYPLLSGVGYADAVNGKTPVRFIESRVAGFETPEDADLMDEPAWRVAIEKARETGRPESCPGLDFRPLSKESSIAIFGAVFRKGKARTPEIKPALRGYVMVSLDTEGLLREKPLAVASCMLRMEPLDSAEPQPVAQKDALNRVMSMSALGHTWNVRFTPGKAFIRDSQAPLPWWVLAGGVAVSGLLFVIVWNQMRLRLKERALNIQLERRIGERTAELRTANLRLEQAVEREHELSILKSNFISMVSHELRNPLGIILSSSQILERYRDRLSPEKRDSQLSAIQHAVYRITALTEEVLLFGRFEAGRVEVQRAPVNLRAFCLTIVDEVLSATSQRCPIELQIEGEFAEARLDEKLMRHVLTNLLQNAVKFSESGSPVELDVSRDDGRAIFQVRDHGVGIPAADQARLFTSFHRSENVRHLPGTGLGLVIVKRCVEAHGGQIEISSIEGSGTTVTVRLPLNPAESAAPLLPSGNLDPASKSADTLPSPNPPAPST